MNRFFRATVSLGIACVLALGLSSCGDERTKKVEVLNFTEAEVGEEIAVLTVRDYGTIKIKLFPEIAPKAVENFKKLCENGYYDETIIYYVKDDECIITGDPKGDGTGGYSADGSYFENELSAQLRNFSGAVGYYCEHYEEGYPVADSNGSRFYIINTEAENGLTDKFFDKVEEYGYYFPKNVKELYWSKGGAPLFDGGYTVFGQVIEGMDIIYEINSVEVDSETLKPKKQIKIDKIEIVEYTE